MWAFSRVYNIMQYQETLNGTLPHPHKTHNTCGRALTKLYS